MAAKRLVLVLALCTATLGVRANDAPMLIEFPFRDGALASAVSAGGTVVGALATGGAFYWMPTTGTVFIGGLDARGVSRDGRTIVGVARDANRIQQAGIWVRGTEWKLLGGFPNTVPCIDSLSAAMAANPDGSVVVGYANFGTDQNACGTQSHAFRWDASTGKMTELESAVPSRFSQAWDISADGKVIVGRQESSIGLIYGVRWTADGRQQAIPPPAGSGAAGVGTAEATNRDGTIAVGSSCRPDSRDPAINQTAWVWTPRDGTQCLPAPRPFVSEGVSNDAPVVVRARATSDDGHIIVGEQGIGATDTEAVIWIDRKPHYLKEYLQANGIPDAFNRWIRTGTLSGVTPDGRVLVGNGAPIGGYNGYVVILGDKP